MSFNKKKVLVVGLGRSGLSAARWLSNTGAEVTINDIKPLAEIDDVLVTECLDLGIHLETGGHKTKTFINTDMIILSPGIPLDIEPLQAARQNDIPVMGEMALALGLIDIPVVAVTGTNGKSTVVTLIGAMLRAAGANVFVGGNIGTPLTDYLADEQEADYAVLEVSSFQLDTMERFTPDVSLLLNISPDHLDRYVDYDAYVHSKLKICRDQGVGQYAVLNDDDDQLTHFTHPGKVSVWRYGFGKKENRHAYIEKGKLVVKLPERETHLFDLERFSLSGKHNIENLMGAVLAAHALQQETQAVQYTIDHFQGLAHRMEKIGQVKGIDFIDDSKATNVDAAIRSITSFNSPVILIAGGRHKGADYAPLVRAAKGKVKKAILIGEAKSLIAEACVGHIPFEFADNMDDAVSKAFSGAEADNMILLAPACSSFDMFTDYADRGNRFKGAMEKISHGESFF